MKNVLLFIGGILIGIIISSLLPKVGGIAGAIPRSLLSLIASNLTLGIYLVIKKRQWKDSILSDSSVFELLIIPAITTFLLNYWIMYREIWFLYEWAIFIYYIKYARNFQILRNCDSHVLSGSCSPTFSCLLRWLWDHRLDWVWSYQGQVSEESYEGSNWVAWPSSSGFNGRLEACWVREAT